MISLSVCCLKVEILASLQKPKKISLKGSDGKFYTMMCKPKDDLRKDCRLMEFNCLINKVQKCVTLRKYLINTSHFPEILANETVVIVSL